MTGPTTSNVAFERSGPHRDRRCHHSLRERVDFQDDDLLETCFTDDATASFAASRRSGRKGHRGVPLIAAGAPVIGSTHRFGKSS